MRAPHLGLAGERCRACGHIIETLLDSHGRNPLRLCWRCEQEAIERDRREQMTNRAAGIVMSDRIIERALNEGGGDPEKAIALARTWVIIGGPEGTSEENFERIIAEPIRMAALKPEGKPS